MKAVLFDLFGTLVDNATNPQVASVLNDMADALQLPRDEFAAGWKTTFTDRSRGLHGSISGSIAAAASQCNGEYSEAGLARAVEIRIMFVRAWLTPRKDAVETIVKLREKGFRLGLLSNCSKEVPELWISHPFAELINVPLFSCNEGLRKPTLEFYYRALERLNVRSHECLYVADGDNGELAAASGVGMEVIMIRVPEEIDPFLNNREDWDGPRIERLSELLHLEILNKIS